MSMVIPIGKTCVALGKDVFEKIKNQVRGFDQCEAFAWGLVMFFLFKVW